MNSDRDGLAIVRSVLVGAVSGLRSAAGPALAARELHHARARRRGALPRRVLAAEPATKVTAALAAGELLADKHPDIPNRTAPPALVGRAAAGAFAAAALVSRRASFRTLCAHGLIGAGAAVLAAHLGYEARRRLGESTGAPDRLIGLVEDALTYAGGALAMRAVRH